MYTWRFMDISTHIELYPSYYLSCIYSLNSTIQRKEDILGLISIQGNVLNKFDAAIVSSTISLWYIIYNSFDFIPRKNHISCILPKIRNGSNL